MLRRVYLRDHRDDRIGFTIVAPQLAPGHEWLVTQSLARVETSDVTLSSYFLSGSDGSGVELLVAMIIEVGELWGTGPPDFAPWYHREI